MDEFKLNLSTKIMRGIVTKLISRALYKKYGCKVDIQLNELCATIIDGKARLHIDADGEINKDEFMKLMKSVTLD